MPSCPGPASRLVPATRPGSNTPLHRLARIIGRGGAYKSAPLLRTEPGAHGYVRPVPRLRRRRASRLRDADPDGEDTTVAAPFDITFDRVYVHGHRYKGQKRGFTLNGTRINILNSYVSDIKVGQRRFPGDQRLQRCRTVHDREQLPRGRRRERAVRRRRPCRSRIWCRPTSCSAGTTCSNRWNGVTRFWRRPAARAPRQAAGARSPRARHYFRVVAVMSTGTRTGALGAVFGGLGDGERGRTGDGDLDGGSRRRQLSRVSRHRRRRTVEVPRDDGDHARVPGDRRSLRRARRERHEVGGEEYLRAEERAARDARRQPAGELLVGGAGPAMRSC